MSVTPTPTRRVAGRPSARALLLSVLGQFVVPTGGGAWTSTIVAALEDLGVEEKAARQALSRTAADGWLEREPRGRQTRWEITPSGSMLLAEAWRRLERSLMEPPEWSGRWLLVTLLAPIGDRTTRRRLASRLQFEGFGVLGADTWIAADPRAAAGARGILEECGLTDQAAVVEGAVLSPDGPAARAWDLDAAATANREFLDAFPDEFPADDRAAFVLSNRMAHAWREVLAVDPVLPAELLPSDWPGVEARRRFVDLWWRTAEPASSHYTRLTADAIT